MFALLAVILAAVGLFMTLAAVAVPGWLTWAFFVCVALHLLVGTWPFGTIIRVNRSN